MKNIVIKIIKISIILIMSITINSNATSLNLSTNLEKTKVEDEIIVKAKTDKNIETATFYLKYDSTKLEFIENLTEKTIIKDYPEEGILRVVYLDPTLQGESELDFRFKVRENSKENVTISITNLTIQFINDSIVYTEENLDESTFETSIKVERKNLFTPGIWNAFIAVGILLILLVTIKSIHKKEI